MTGGLAWLGMWCAVGSEGKLAQKGRIKHLAFSPVYQDSSGLLKWRLEATQKNRQSHVSLSFGIIRMKSLPQSQLYFPDESTALACAGGPRAQSHSPDLDQVQEHECEARRGSESQY